MKDGLTVSTVPKTLPPVVEVSSPPPIPPHAETETPPPGSVPPPIAKDVNHVHDVQSVAWSGVSTGMPTLPEATVDEFLSFVTAFGGQGASSIQRTGNALIINCKAPGATESHAVKVPLSALSTAIGKGIISRDSPLMHSLQIYEAAQNTGLSHAAVRTLVASYQTHVAAGAPPKEALLRVLTNVAVAGQVEAYVENKDGLSSDIRRTAEFTKDAFDGHTAGGTLQALKNRTVRTDVIRTAQLHLDDKLHKFTDAFAQARETGDYDKAFDALEGFFRTSAHVAETDYWRSRPTTVLASLQSSRPPGPRDGLPPVAITTSLPDPQPSPAARPLQYPQPRQATSPSVWGQITETLRAGLQWLTGQSQVATVGTRHDGAAARMLAQLADATPVGLSGTRWQGTGSAAAVATTPPAAPSSVLSLAYLLRFDEPQRKAIAGLEGLYRGLAAPLTTPQARQDYAVQAKAMVATLVTAGIPEPEASALLAQFERRNCATVNPELSGIVGNRAYDMAKDPTMTGQGPQDVTHFLQQLDHRGALAVDLRAAITACVNKAAPGKDARQAILSGAVTPGAIIAHLRATQPSLLREAHRAMDADKLPAGIRDLARQGQAQDFDEATLLQLFGTTGTGPDSKTVLDNIFWSGASGMGASQGADDLDGKEVAGLAAKLDVTVGGGYVGLSDSAVRMDHKAMLFGQLSFLADQPDHLAGGIAIRRAKMNKDLAAAQQAHKQATQGMADAPPGVQLGNATLKRAVTTLKVVQLTRALHDLDVVEKTLNDAVASGDPKSHLGYRTMQAIATMNPVERLAIIAYTSELYSVVNSALRFTLPSVTSDEKPEMLAWTKATQSALNKLPSYVGTTFRQDASNDRQNLLQPGNEVGDKAFTSTAATLDGTQGAAQREMLSISKVTNVKVIADLSHFGSAEREVLMPPFSTHTVEARIDRPADGDWGKVLQRPENHRLLADFGVEIGELETYLKGRLGRGTKTIALQQQI